MSEPLGFNDLHIGDSWTSQGRTVTETDIINFAGITGDYDPLHVDHEHAKRSPFGRPIAHGLLGMSFLAGLGTHSPSVRTTAFLAIHDWQFLAPIFVGDTVRAVNEVVDLQPNGKKRGRVIWKRQLINQRGEIVQAGHFETLVEIIQSKNDSRKTVSRKSRLPA